VNIIFEGLKDLLNINIFNSKKRQEIYTNENEIEMEKRDYGKIYRKEAEFYDNLSFSNSNKRQDAMTRNMDIVLDKIKEETFKLPLLARSILNITSKSSDKFFYFTGENDEKVIKVAKEFNKILKNSNYNPNLFLKEAFQNLVKYSNVFIRPIKDEKDKLIRLRIMPNKGWTVNKRIGTFLCEEFVFEDLYDDGYNNSKRKVFKNKIDIFHYTFNRESDEIFAMPIWCSVIPVIKKYNFLTNNALQSYADQAITRIIYEVGITKSGTIKPTRQDQFDSTSSGRQDAETQDENTLNITNGFFKEMEFQINRTIIDEICMNLFGSLDDEIEMKFSEGFNLEERKEKHAVFLFQGGIITIDEARKMCNKQTKKFEIKNTFQNLYSKTNSEMSGTVENVNNPKNQYTSGTGTTKKTKKN